MKEPTKFTLVSFLAGSPTDGGAYTHKLGTLRVLHRLQQEEGIRVVVVCDAGSVATIVREHGLEAVVQQRGFWARLCGRLSATEIAKVHFGASYGPRLSPVDGLVRRLGADLVLFCGPDPRALQLYSCGYVFTVLDLAHLEYPQFPEVSLHGEFERRERLFRHALPKAVAVLADSEAGRRLVATHYAVPMARTFAAPFLMGSSVRDFVADPAIAAAVRSRYGLADSYIFYPAQFWAHKNHRYIIAALAIMKKKLGWAPQAVFCGSDKGALESVLGHAQHAGMAEHVKYCGFVPAEDIPYLYVGALALVMPTYFGPTNIPPLEALSLGTAVCYSDLPAFREHLGDAVTYIDLERPESLAAALQNLHASSRGDQTRNPVRNVDTDDAYLAVLRRVIHGFRLTTGSLPIVT